jgi:hypothetical protein
LVDTSKKDENGNPLYIPASGVYYIKQKIDGETYYVLWEPEIKEGEALQFDPEVSYFYREEKLGEYKEGFFAAPVENGVLGERIG